MEYFRDGRDWFFQKRYGMFIHWGLYAIGGFHEQEQFRKNISRKEYAAYQKQFCPTKFDPRQWIRTAKACGMEYMVFTTKHQDGFCMWDTAYTDFNCMNTPYGKDILKELADACHEENFPLLLYYCITDNHHPNYPNRGIGHELPMPQENDHPDTLKYLDYVRNQIRELCTKYGTIHGIFWDVNHLDYYDESFNWLVRDLQPNAVVNGRGFDCGDYNTPEREFNEGDLQAQRRFVTPTEACQSVGIHSWGYKTDEDFYSSKFLMQSMDRILAMGGNYLLNVGPTPEGELDERGLQILQKIADWKMRTKEAFYDAVPVSDVLKSRDMFATCRDNDLYIHFYKDPVGTSVELVPLEMLPEQAILLNDGRPLTICRSQGTKLWTSPMEYVRVCGLPTDAFCNEVMIVKLHYKHLPRMVRELRDNWEFQEPAPIKQKMDF